MKGPFDVGVAGGGLAGLFAARELAMNGLSCVVFEEDLEIGLPEKCDGLVSLRALKEMKAPQHGTTSNTIERAVLHSPGGIALEVDARRQGVVVLDRAKFDQALAAQATARGCHLVLGSRVSGLVNEEDEVKVRSGDSEYKVSYVIEARGCKSLVSKSGREVLHAGKYVVYGKWFDRHTVEIYLDQEVTPGFFVWVIPINEETAKVGAAGRGINPFKVLDSFLEGKRGGVLRKVAAPISIGGSIDDLTNGRICVVGDAAGQAKPTTGGGIYTGGLAGILAGRAMARSFSEGVSLDYEARWKRRFSAEFRKMLVARKLMDILDNKRLDEAFGLLKDSSILQEISLEGDFDFHSIALTRALGLKGMVRLLSLARPRELRSLLSLMLR